jgi:hypothetical protein
MTKTKNKTLDMEMVAKAEILNGINLVLFWTTLINFENSVRNDHHQWVCDLNHVGFNCGDRDPKISTLTVHL